MSDNEALNTALSHFQEAANLSDAVRSLELRAQSASPLPPEQHAQRKAIIAIACVLIRESISDALKLGAHYYKLHIEEQGT